MPRDVQSELRDGILAILPATVAAVPFAMLLGQQAAAKGLSPIEILAMSAIVFAGSAQFLAVSLWTDPTPVAALALSALLINLRHVLMGASIAGKVGHFGALRWPLAFLMTDEQWAVTERRALTHRVTPAYWVGAGGFLYLAWQCGTVAGAMLGALIADPARWGMDFAFPAIFIALVAGFWKGWRTAPVVVASATAAVVVHRLVPGPWYVIAGALAGIAAAVVTSGEKATSAEARL
jgi:4-azaleucine resistance transporter AzlC